MSIFRNKVLLITGGTGSFGNAVLRRFLDSDIKEIRIFSRDEKKQDDMRHHLQNPKVKFYIGNVRDRQSVDGAMMGVDYAEYDYLIGMDGANIRNMLRIFGGDPEGKVAKLLSYAGSERDISDPWYTGEFGTTYDDVLEGCTAFLEYLQQNSKIDT